MRLEIFGVSGQRVRLLVDGPLAAGEHRRVWDGRDEGGRPVGSGLYLCRLRVGERTETCKLLLVR